MEKKLKKMIKDAFNAPMPTRKAEFLMSFDYPKAGRLDFFITQLGYVRKRVWTVSFLMIVAVVIAMRYHEVGMVVWVVASFLPFFVVLGITEIAKSMSYNMAELEMSCRYSLSNITLARLGTIGTVNAAMFIILTALLSYGNGMGLFGLVVQMFTPYLLACYLSLFLMKRFRNKEQLYICGGASFLVSITSIVVFNPLAMLLPGENWLFWAFWILLILAVGEIVKFIKRLGDYQWNLSLTD